MQVDVTLEYTRKKFACKMKIGFIVSTCMEYTIDAIAYSTGKDNKVVFTMHSCEKTAHT